MKVLSVCSGIGAETVAWKKLDFQTVAFAEVAPFPSAVLAHHYPNIPNLGDLTQNEKWKIEADIIIGGTPCQSFSVAGLRKGFSDSRGDLARQFCRLVTATRPRWFVWENVPGALNTDNGAAFKCIVNFLEASGYGLAWRIIDAIKWLPQRRRRLFLIGYLGDWRPPVAVLFITDRRALNNSKVKKSGKSIAGGLAGSGNRYRLFRNTGYGYRYNYIESPHTNTLTASDYMSDNADIILNAAGEMRRLSPKEYERLMGFRDNYTRIAYRNKPAKLCPRSNRCIALGNSIAVPVLRHIGERIQLVEQVISEQST